MKSSWRDSTHCQSPGIITADVNSYERRAVDNIYSCSGEKGRWRFLFWAQDSFVSYAEGLFSFAVLHFACLSLAFAPQANSFLPFPPVFYLPGAFLLVKSTARVSSQRPLQSNPVPRESRARGRFTGSEELEETHKHPIEARLHLAASSIGVKLQAVRSSRQAPKLLPIENQLYLLRKTPWNCSRRSRVCAKIDIEIVYLSENLSSKRMNKIHWRF